MLDPYALTETLRLERQLLAERQARQATWPQHRAPTAPGRSSVTVRRHLARALLALADRLDPRAVVSVPHVPVRPSLNGRPHHA